ncbi:60S ribosomal protein L18a-like protein isoform X1 [Quercus lobata]|uniref:60S ribosomal protein L18a-like protein isoform X1 n=1 Tax=Quercus lobata TaxID=97700 RepID=UPI0012448433|nr:60S ribosomal protein L18a-like protein isoform X1 [Quercus lobata]
MLGQITDAMGREKGKYTLVKDLEHSQLGTYDKPLPCFGCGIGWFSFLLGFVFPLLWYYATILYFGNYYRRDPRERAGLAASAIAVITLSLSQPYDGTGFYCSVVHRCSYSFLLVPVAPVSKCY